MRQLLDGHLYLPLTGVDWKVSNPEQMCIRDRAWAIARSDFRLHRVVCDPGHSAVVADFLSGYFSRPPTDPIDPFDEAELETAISRLRPKRAPGEDRIGAAALLNAPASLVSLIHVLFNGCLRLHYYPCLLYTSRCV